MTARERDDLLIRMDERLMALQNKMVEVLAEQKKTNGRVSTLEDTRLPDLEKWQAGLKGSIRTLIMICTGAGALLGIIASIITAA